MQERNTLQKEAVYAALRELGNHPTAEMVYDRVKISHPGISRATVYRVLGNLAQQGIILRISGDGADHYDARIAPHCHVQCSRCGRMDDVMTGHMGDLIGAVNDACGYTLSGVSVVYQGLCRECQRALDEDKSQIFNKGE